MKKTTKMIVVFIAVILILTASFLIWKSSTEPIIPDGYTEVKGFSNFGSWDGYPPYDVTPKVIVDYARPPRKDTPKKLMRNCDLVISGKVLSFSESNWSTPDGQKPERVKAESTFDENGKFISISISSPDLNEYIYTDMDVQVDTIHKGKLNYEIITIRLLTGTVGDYMISADGGIDVRNYEEGDEVFLLLRSLNDDENAENVYSIPSPQCAYVKL